MGETTVAILHHGCAKNLIDTELMVGLLNENGYKTTLEEDDADVVVVNTCSFINDAEKESVESIFKMIEKGKKIIITGCLSQKYQEELKDIIPEAIGFLGTTQYNKILLAVQNAQKDIKTYEVEKEPKYFYDEGIKRQQITMGSSSYLKIAEGCNYNCGYCIIPQLRGKYSSRTIENIVKEAKELADKGVSEIILIAQDTTSWGIDLYKKPSLAKLLKELEKIENISWIRIMYTYPNLFDDELIEVIANSKKIVKYLDIPLQHSHPEMLKLMNRPVADYEELINKLREKIEGLAIRTSFIVGYPKETEEHFKHLCDFVEKMKFDRVGVFEFSKEKNTVAYSLKPQILKKIKGQRKKELMKIQQKISLEKNEELIGKNIKCLIEEVYDDYVVGRSYRDAPEVDGLVYLKTDKNVVPGEFEMVKILSVNEYDLFGEI